MIDQTIKCNDSTHPFYRYPLALVAHDSKVLQQALSLHCTLITLLSITNQMVYDAVHKPLSAAAAGLGKPASCVMTLALVCVLLVVCDGTLRSDL